MTVILARHHVEESVEMRNVYCSTLMAMAEHDGRIVILDADLMNSMGMVPFAKNTRNGLSTAAFRKPT